MFLSPLVQTFTMEDWLVECVFTCKGKEYRRTIGTDAWQTEAGALGSVRQSICSGRRSLPEGHPMARPPITKLEMTPYRRHNHPRHRRDTQDLSAIELLAKG